MASEVGASESLRLEVGASESLRPNPKAPKTAPSTISPENRSESTENRPKQQAPRAKVGQTQKGDGEGGGGGVTSL